MAKETMGMGEGFSAKKTGGPRSPVSGLKQGDKTKTPDGVEVEVIIVEEHRVVVKINGGRGIYPRGILVGDT